MPFSYFIDDLTYVVENTCPLYNCANNSFASWHMWLDDLKLNFEYGSKIAFIWFQECHMKTNVSDVPDAEFHVSGPSLKPVKHCDDVIMTTIASQITSLTSVYSTVYSDADQRKRQSSASLAFVRGIHRDR